MDNIKKVKQAPKRKKAISLDRKKARTGWLFILPFLTGFLAIYLPIILNSIRFSFSSVSSDKQGLIIKFEGLSHYNIALFKNPDFVKTLTSGLQQLIFDIPAIVIFSLFMAVLLNQKMMGRAAFRAIFFIPVILSTGLIDQINNSENSLLQYIQNNKSIDTGSSNESASDIISKGDLSSIFLTLKLGSVGTNIIGYIQTAVKDVYGIINRSGVQMLVFLAGLQSISPAIYESCSIDGATSWETFWKITFPMISPMILVNAIYTVIDSFTSSSNTVIKTIKDTMTADNSLGSAMAWIYFTIVILLIAIVAAILSAYIFYQRRD